MIIIIIITIIIITTIIIIIIIAIVIIIIIIITIVMRCTVPSLQEAFSALQIDIQDVSPMFCKQQNYGRVFLLCRRTLDVCSTARRHRWPLVDSET